jgi:DNA-binding transcriptional MerR regulator
VGGEAAHSQIILVQVDFNASIIFAGVPASSYSRPIIEHMGLLPISEVARMAGLRPSAIRYYEQIGILPPALRVSGQRRYHSGTIHRLAVLRRAQEVGFTLDEVRELFCGLGNRNSISERWRKLAGKKLTELDAAMERIRSMQEVLCRLQTRCRCDTVEQCGASILRSRVIATVIKNQK